MQSAAIRLGRYTNSVALTCSCERYSLLHHPIWNMHTPCLNFRKFEFCIDFQTALFSKCRLCLHSVFAHTYIHDVYKLPFQRCLILECTLQPNHELELGKHGPHEACTMLDALPFFIHPTVALNSKLALSVWYDTCATHNTATTHLDCC